MPKRIAYPDTDAFPSDHQQGLTKREYFASQAMIGLLSNPNLGGNDSDIIAKIAVDQADRLFEALNE